MKKILFFKEPTQASIKDTSPTETALLEHKPENPINADKTKLHGILMLRDRVLQNSIELAPPKLKPISRMNTVQKDISKIEIYGLGLQYFIY